MRAKPLPAETRRAVTVEAVIELAAERDPGEITTAAIASHMKLTQGALFRHFPSKDAIWEAVMEWVAERLLARVDRAAAQAASPLAALQAIFLAHADFVAEHPGVPRMLFGELQRAEATPAKRLARALLERYGERIRGRLEAGKAAGEVSAALDIDAGVILFVGTLQGLIMQSMLAGDLLRIRRDAPRVFAIYLAGIRSAT
ncbi:TetR/AcrR family transcriptional regulator [Thauera aminoaromatica]|uniref:TetR/AcrR family transcriptional regulator n=1 Tax=Thauera aminoaromatica TaxID=164330 RepID=UPI0023561928|nr:TetR family transcriptional regulator [Thauera aminoaromatica]MCK6397409.1 TetR family transcriptional regulator [Thauera aminoaromatica]